MNISSKQIKIDHRNLSYWLRAGGQRYILFVHGLGCAKDYFIHAFKEYYFSEDYTLLAPDLLGHGESSKPENFSYAIEKQCDIILELINNLNIYHLNIVAHSMGGVIALLLLEKLNNIRSFFCLEGNLVAEDCFFSRKIAALNEKEFVTKIYAQSPNQFKCKGIPSEKSATPIAFYRSAKSLVDWSVHGNLLNKYNDLLIKTAYFYGERNKEIAVLKKLKNRELVQINNSGHFMMVDNPRDTYQEIMARLNALDA